MAGHVTGLGRHRQTVLAAQNRADFVALELELSQPKFKGKDGSAPRRKIEPWCFPVSIIAFLVLLLICIPLFGNEKVPDDGGRDTHGESCNDTCRVKFHPAHSEQEDSLDKTKPFTKWSDLLPQAESSIDLLIVQSKCKKPSYLKALPVSAAIRIRVILIVEHTEKQFNFTSWLDVIPEHRENPPEIRTLSLGFRHSASYSLPKMILVDQSHFAISSRTMALDGPGDSWALAAYNCSCSSVVSDLQRVFQTYWSQAQSSVDSTQPIAQKSLSKERGTVQDPFDSAFPISMTMPFAASSSINVSTSFHNTDQRMPSGLSLAFPHELLTNVEAICAVLQASREFLYISVMNYQPQLSLHETRSNSSDTGNRSTYWPAIDSALRTAFVSRPLSIKMIVSHEPSADRRFLKSLKALDGLNGNSLQIKTMNVRSPDTASWPALASNFVVTANAAHFGTSSWDGDSLSKLPGVGLTVLSSDFCQEHTPFCSVIRAQREAWGSDKPAASGSRTSGSARAAAPPSQRQRTAKEQQKAPSYPSPRLSSSQIALQTSVIAHLKTLFETQWDHPDANEL